MLQLQHCSTSGLLCSVSINADFVCFHFFIFSSLFLSFVFAVLVLSFERSASYRVVGNIFFSNNKQSKWKAREEKIVSLDDATAHFLKLRLFECHRSPANKYGQIGIVLLEIDGVLGGNNGAKNEVLDNYTREDIDKARALSGGRGGPWKDMSWEERLEALQNAPKEIEEDDDNLPQIFSDAGIDWGKHGFSLSYNSNRAADQTTATSHGGDGGASSGLPLLPGMVSEVDRVLAGLGLPLDLIRQPSMSNPKMDYTTQRLLQVIEQEKDTAVNSENFENAVTLSTTMEDVMSIGSEMQTLKKEKEFAVLTGDYKSAAKAKKKMDELEVKRMTIGKENAAREAALAPGPTWEEQEAEEARAAKARDELRHI